MWFISFLLGQIKMRKIRGEEEIEGQRRMCKYVDGGRFFLQRSRLCIFICIATAGCASTSTQRVYRNMIVAGAIGAGLGSADHDYPETKAIMYGSMGAAIAAAATLYFDGPDKEELRLRQEVETLKAKLDQITEPKLVSERPATFGAALPEKYKSMIHPGSFKVYELDRWESDSDNHMIHIDKEMELIPPALTGG